MLGIGHAISQKWVYDQHYGVPLAKRFHYNKPPTILDIPEKMSWDAVNLPDPQTPVGAKGIADELKPVDVLELVAARLGTGTAVVAS